MKILILVALIFVGTTSMSSGIVGEEIFPTAVEFENSLYYELFVLPTLIPEPEPIPSFIEYSIYQYIVDQCAELGINPYFAMSILRTENCQGRANPPANVNRNGSRDLGMWQINSNYLDWFVSRHWHHRETFNVHDPFHNTYVALRIIQSLYHQTRNVPGCRETNVAMAYNGGIGRVLSGTSPQASINYAHRTVANFKAMQFSNHFMTNLHSIVIELPLHIV